MLTETKHYTYEIIKPHDEATINSAAKCLADTFIGVQVGDKWIQEPIIGYALQLPYDDFYAFTKEYICEHVAQGYCAVALNEAREVVGALVGDHNAFVIGGFPTFTGSFSNMNVVVDVLDDIDERFLQDQQLRNGQSLQDGEVLHIFLLGVCAPTNRHEVIAELGMLLQQRAEENGIRMMLAETTNPKSIRVFEECYGFEKYKTVDGQLIVHTYAQNEHLAVIPQDMADGIYIVTKSLT